MSGAPWTVIGLIEENQCFLMRDDFDWDSVAVAALFGVLVLSVMAFLAAGSGGGSGPTEGVETGVNSTELLGDVVNASRDVTSYRYKAGGEVGFVDRDDGEWFVRRNGRLTSIRYDGETYTRSGYRWNRSGDARHDPLADVVDMYFRNVSLSILDSYGVDGETRHLVRTKGNASHVVGSDGTLYRSSVNGSRYLFFPGESARLAVLVPHSDELVGAGNDSLAAGGGDGPTTEADEVRDLPREVGRIEQIIDTDTVRMMIARQGTFVSRKVELVGLDGVNPNEEIRPERFGDGYDADCLRSLGFTAREDLERYLGNNTYLKVRDTREDILGEEILVGYVYIGNLPVEVPSNYDRLLNHIILEKGYADLNENQFPLRSDFEDARDRARQANDGIWGCG